MCVVVVVFKGEMFQANLGRSTWAAQVRLLHRIASNTLLSLYCTSEILFLNE